MRRAKPGDAVRIHYIGTLDNGRIFDSTTDREPLRFTIGAGDVFPALEEAVCGMAERGVKNVPISADQAYGPHLRENLLILAREELPAGAEPRLGQKVRIDLRGGAEVLMRVIKVTEAEVTLDGNHPLAGLDLTFALRLEEIE